MTNAVEILFGIGAAGLLGGVVLYVMKKPDSARKLLSLGFAALILGVIGEVFLRVMP